MVGEEARGHLGEPDEAGTSGVVSGTDSELLPTSRCCRLSARRALLQGTAATSSAQPARTTSPLPYAKFS